ncbi:uroporphyrinogen-III synthase [Edaphobacter albus]|uniref:uroporphyrinogen-III synthase n=1 Tax=Edaphobacter sp. 4G125 TaxID=2763071 RepID=UPI0021070AED|nr:uroporphyrinogen-III synthase [Edaphobacter sp. 4G125]
MTRASGRVSELAALLTEEGATVISLPTIQIIPPESYAALDTALEQLDRFDWIVFTSIHAVEVFLSRRNPAIAPGQIAVIGPATAKAVEQAGLSVSLLPPRYIAESLAEALVPRVAGGRILMIRAAEARDIIPAALIQAGAEVTLAEAYRNQIPPDALANLKQIFQFPADRPDIITFTSASTARNLATLLETAQLSIPSHVILASIGPITSQTMRDRGMEPDVEASEATIPALVRTISNYFATR